jgi:hypothetical protein
MKTAILSLVLTIVCTAARAQDPVKTSPQYYKVLIDNEEVRVLEYHLKPGENKPMHSHPRGFVYALSDAKLRISFPDGHTEETVMKTGERTGAKL